MMIDQFGRRATDLRISVTDRCNYRCTYGMPEKVQWLPRPQILTFEEIERLAQIFVSEGINEIRLTGGEPLVRRDLPILVRKLCKLTGVQDVSLTTNGYYLGDLAGPLYDAGIRRINVSLDTLKPEKFVRITRNDSFHRVMEGISAAKKVGFSPIKINCVAIRGFNDDEIIDFLEWGVENELQIRFIEFMPLDGDHDWKPASVLTQSELLEKVRAWSAFSDTHSDRPSPAQRYRYAEGRGEFGVIPSVSRPFCATCTRVRLTADGKLRACLFSLEESDLRGPLRAGADDEELAQIMRETISRKWAGHKINHPDFVQPQRAMYSIGG